MVKRIILAEVCGILIITVSSLLLSFISIYLFSNEIMRSENIFNNKDDFNRVLSNPPFIYIRWITYVLNICIFILGGFSVGVVMKNKGWLWGGVLGVSIGLLSYFSFALIGSYINPKAIYSVTVLSLLSSSLPAVFLTGLGGFLGEILTKSKSRK